MPKDNEVDEKAENWDYCRDLRIAVTDGKNGARATLNGHGAPAGISLYHGDYVAELKAEAAAYAATVAELRAEVERLRKSNELYSFAMNTAGIDELKRRADAAERRVGELEAFVTAVRTECFDYYNEGIRPWPHHMQTLAWKADEVLEHATLTGADPK